MSLFLSFSSALKYGGYILLAIIILLFMVLIHELGHYTAGKILKFKINEFSIGFGPKLLQKKRKNGEVISLRAFPLGGFCAFEGEGEDGKDNPNAFNKQKPWKRLIVLFFGAFFNFLSGIIFSFILLVSCGYDLIEVKQVAPTSINYGVFQAGDVLTGVAGNKVNFVKDEFFQTLITNQVKGNDAYKFVNNEDSYIPIEVNGEQLYMQLHSIKYNVKRDGENIELLGNINIIYDKDYNYKGWALTSNYNDAKEGEFEVGSYRYNFGEALTQCIPFTFKWAWKILVIFGKLLTGKLSISTLGGPVSTVNMIASYTRMNASYLVTLLPVIAINLAVFNLLPIPALDGCQMLFVAIEWARRKPLNQKVINAINNIGLIVLFAFVIVVDILQFI